MFKDPFSNFENFDCFVFAYSEFHLLYFDIYLFVCHRISMQGFKSSEREKAKTPRTQEEIIKIRHKLISHGNYLTLLIMFPTSNNV